MERCQILQLYSFYPSISLITPPPSRLPSLHPLLLFLATPSTVHTKLRPIAFERARVMRHHLISRRRRLPLALLQDLSCCMFEQKGMK